MPIKKIPCAIIRGGTSKGIFLHADDLPDDPDHRDRVILSIFGSPDKRQIDGLGGADPLTSKLAIITPSTRNDIDIDYTFGQVAIDTPSINYSLNCGNILSGAAIYAVDEGMVKITTPVTTVNIFNTNTKTHISAQVLIAGNKAAVAGDFKVDGVPGTGAVIKLTFNDIAGSFTGKLLPTGNPIDSVSPAPDKTIDVSIIDAGNLYAIVEASSLGLKGTESPAELESDLTLIAICQDIMNQCTQLIAEAVPSDPQVKLQKLAIVSIPDATPSSPSTDFTGRIISLNGKPHKSYAVTGAISTASSALIHGTILNRLIPEKPTTEFTISHPEGTLNIKIETQTVADVAYPVGATIKRTARRIMDGFVYLHPDI